MARPDEWKHWVIDMSSWVGGKYAEILRRGAEKAVKDGGPEAQIRVLTRRIQKIEQMSAHAQKHPLLLRRMRGQRELLLEKIKIFDQARYATLVRELKIAPPEKGKQFVSRV
jgi:ribosomal protein S15P/S13E